MLGSLTGASESYDFNNTSVTRGFTNVYELINQLSFIVCRLRPTSTCFYSTSHGIALSLSLSLSLSEVADYCLWK